MKILSSTFAIFSTATSKSLRGAALQFTKIVLMYLDTLRRFLLPRLAPLGFRFLADEKRAKAELRGCLKRSISAFLVSGKFSFTRSKLRFSSSFGLDLELFKQALCLQVVGVIWGAGLLAAVPVVFGQTSEEMQDERWRIVVGQTKTLEVAEDTRLHVSRRGVVDVLQKSERSWSILALQRGVISLTLTGDQGQQRRVIIEVSSRDLATRRSEEVLNCERIFGLICEPGRGFVSGVADDYRRFYAAKRLCEEALGCIFDAELSEVGRQRLIERIEGDLGQRSSVEVRSSGLVVLWSNCGTRSDDSVREILARVVGVPDSADVVRLCHDQKSKKVYRLQARIFLVDQNELTDSGLEPLSSGLSTNLTNAQTQSLNIRLHDLISRKKAVTVGEPVLRLNSGSSGSISSGGEVETSVQQSDEKGARRDGHFKKTGLDLTMHLTEIGSGAVRVSYKMMLSQNTHPGAERLQLATTALEGELDLKTGISTVVGGSLFEAHGESGGSSVLLERVPILGPLLSWSAKDEGRRKAFLWLSVEPDEGGGQKDLQFKGL